MGLEHLPDPSELKSEMLESTAEFHSYAEIENYKNYFVIDDSVELTAPPSRICAFCDRKYDCEEYMRVVFRAEKGKTMTQEERERIKKRFAPLCDRPPLMEGMRPGRMVMLADGTRVWKESPPAEEWKDQELENMTILDKDEFYDHVTRCKKCGTEFIAFLNDEAIRKFCPGCGKELE